MRHAMDQALALVRAPAFPHAFRPIAVAIRNSMVDDAVSMVGPSIGLPTVGHVSVHG